MTQITKPSVSDVRKEQGAIVDGVATEASDAIARSNRALKSARADADRQMQQRLADAAEAEAAGIAASLQNVDAAEADVDAARQVLADAEASLKGAKTVDRQERQGLAATFRSRSDRAAAANKRQKAEARQARKAEKAAQKAKVKQAKTEGRAAVNDEAKALGAYKVYKTKDTTVRVAHGANAVRGVLSEAFRTGFSEDTGVQVPESLAKRQRQTPSPK